MTRQAPTVGAFVLRTFLWLPACFAGWYAVAGMQSGAAVAFARLFVSFLDGLLVSATELYGSEVTFVTRLAVEQAQGGRGVLVVEVNTLVYTYGLALFVALMLASRSKWWRVLAGAALLLPVQGWGIGFDFLAHVGAKLGPEVAAQARLLGAREFIAIAYQVGNLVLPSLAPVALWVYFNREYVAGLAANVRRRTDAPPDPGYGGPMKNDTPRISIWRRVASAPRGVLRFPPAARPAHGARADRSAKERWESEGGSPLPG